MLHNMKGQFAEHLLGAGFVSSRSPKDPKANINSGKAKQRIDTHTHQCKSLTFNGLSIFLFFPPSTFLLPIDNEKIIKAVICAGLYPKVAKIRLNLGKKRKM